MDFSAINDLYIGSTPVQSAWLNGSKVWGRKPAMDEQSIRDAMILWYDLKKQGATNESMASTPELVNHAYDPDKANVIDWTQFSTRGDGVQQFSIEITSTTNYWVVNQAAYHRTNSIPSFYVEVANLPEGHTINYFYGDGSDERKTYVVSYNGIHKIPACRVSPNVTTATGWFIDPNNPTGQTVADLVGTTITQVNPTFNATCYNFAWSGASGIGLYSLDPNYYQLRGMADSSMENAGYRYVLRTTDDSILHIGKMYTVTDSSNPFIRPAFKLKVSGLEEDEQWYLYEDNSVRGRNGEFDIQEFVDSGVTSNWVGFSITPSTFSNRNIVFEILPIYPNALVSDGVDDYCLVEGLPLLNKEDGYTVIAKRKWLDETLACGLISKLDDGMNTSGAFGFELNNMAGQKTIVNWGRINQITLEKNDISYGTATKYNSTNINSDDNQIDTDYISIFKYSKEPNYYGQFALYSLILFNRDLTLEEIEWVKTNLITE